MKRKIALFIVFILTVIFLSGCVQPSVKQSKNQEGETKSHPPKVIATVKEAMSDICGCLPTDDQQIQVRQNHSEFETILTLEKTGEDKIKHLFFFTEKVEKLDREGVLFSSVTNKYIYDASEYNYEMIESTVNPTKAKEFSCTQSLERLGQFSEEGDFVDYKSGLRIFPLLYFMLTKTSIPAALPNQAVYMQDNPIFVTRDEKHPNLLLFSPVHSKRTGALQGVIGFPDNEITEYYEPMVFGKKTGYVKQVPSTEIGPLNKLIDVTRKTWGNELAEYTEPCKELLLLPPAKEEPPFFPYNGKVYPFSKEIDFVAGAEGVGLGLIENGILYPGDNKIQIPILLYCPKCQVEDVVMVQDQEELEFQPDRYNDLWKKWLGESWHMFLSEKIDFDEERFAKADLGNIKSSSPPFTDNKPTTIRVKINGEFVEFVNQ
ncbi:hypothetical protein [Paenibacillus turpanensis]|uniref:hypothetical protein n=1 Tax=Paenibacillus turpanensis TaxID=2689078 RepID=UPI00140B49ED|nr:hypothetical protein [Paenibacillus turpanensis]